MRLSMLLAMSSLMARHADWMRTPEAERRRDQQTPANHYGFHYVSKHGTCVMLGRRKPAWFYKKGAMRRRSK